MLNWVVGVTSAVLERAGDGDRLERRARLVVEAHGTVLGGVRGRARGVVGVDPRPVGERQDRAGVRVHHDRGGALGRVLLADAGEHLLHLVLQCGVDRQRQRLAGLRRPDVVDRDRLADRVVDDLPLARRARAGRCCTGTRARSGRGRPADAAEHLRGRPARGYTRLVCGISVEPSNRSFMIAAAVAAGRRWARYTNPVCGLVSSVSTVVHGMPSSGASLRAIVCRVLDQVRVGDDVVGGLAGSRARSPLRSVIAPRAAGIVTLVTCWVTAARFSEPALTDPR